MNSSGKAGSRETSQPLWRRSASLIAYQRSDALIGRQTGVGSDQLYKAIRLEDRLHHGFPVPRW